MESIIADNPLLDEAQKSPSATTLVISSVTIPETISWQSLLDHETEFHPSTLSNVKQKTSRYRQKLAALREDLQGGEETETDFSPQFQDPKMKKWVTDNLQRSIWLRWERKDRFGALRSACLLAGSLGFPSNLSEWVLVTDTLNSFAQSVSHYLTTTTPKEKQVWILKISHIRGLLARLYMQTATWDWHPSSALNLVQQSRGILHTERRLMLLAYMSTKTQFQKEHVIEVLQLGGGGSPHHRLLLSLVLVATNTNTSVGFEHVVNQCHHTVALHALVAVSSPQLVVSHATLILTSMMMAAENNACEESVSLLREFASKILLATSLVLHPQVLREAHRVLLCHADPDACSLLLEYACKVQYKEEAMLFLTTLSRYDVIGSGCTGGGLLAATEMDELVVSQAYAHVFDSWPSGAYKQDVARRILERFIARVNWSLFPLALECAKVCEVDDPLLCSQFIFTSCTHRLMSDQDSFHVLVKLRSSFPHNTVALKTVCLRMVSLAQESVNPEKDFLTSCLAFCHATIPSLGNAAGFLYCYVAMVAASLKRLEQCDGMFKAAIQCLATTSLERRLELVRTLSSALVVAPGYPHAFYLVHGFAKAIEALTWTNGQAFLALLSLIECITRLRLPYHVQGVDSNDVLYGDLHLDQEATSLANRVFVHVKQRFPELQEDCELRMHGIHVNLQQRRGQVGSNLV